MLSSGEILKNFDRVVFESVVEKIIIEGYNDEGAEEPLKITFVYKLVSTLINGCCNRGMRCQK